MTLRVYTDKSATPVIPVGDTLLVGGLTVRVMVTLPDCDAGMWPESDTGSGYSIVEFSLN